jgi:AraC family transcriptional regulator of adaptative response/methylated-DNA-[protein]-cysteine methyltransferase
MIAGARDEGLCLLEFADRRGLAASLQALRRRGAALPVPGRNEHLELLARELAAYFEGRLRSFTVPLVAPGTPFQESVWRLLRRVPYGRRMSYGALARALGRPGASRAVGRANGDNRIAILIPCHRIVEGNGSLRGYGGGLWRKQFLLELERAVGRDGKGVRPLFPGEKGA